MNVYKVLKKCVKNSYMVYESVKNSYKVYKNLKKVVKAWTKIVKGLTEIFIYSMTRKRKEKKSC